MRIRENLGGIINNMGRNNFSTNNSSTKVGRVYGVVTTLNTPTKKQFERAGGFNGIGTILYLDFNQSQNIEGNNLDSFLNNCSLAKPSVFNQPNPLLGELVPLYELPSPASEISPNGFQMYYGTSINLYNDAQQNSISNSGRLGTTITEVNDIRNLQPFEGDYIIQNKKSGIRFGSTVKNFSNINEWSNLGNNGDPITILVNGYITSDTGSFIPNIEEINKEQSSIYLTSTQKLPLQPGASIINPRVNTILPKDYNSSQLIFNSDRITLNSKKDEILLFSKTNMELNSDNIININAGKIAHINSPSVLLGINKDGSYPTEPILLGGKTHDLLLVLMSTLSNLAGYLSEACVATSDGTLAIPACNDAGTQLFTDITKLTRLLETITSDKVYTT
jgi:hypothetical protein